MLLLSPAGSPASLSAALKSGADGVYFGGASFNARRGAANFTDMQMQAALDQCHLCGARAFITMNILLLDRELPEAIRYARFLYKAGADGLIIQDLGLARCLREELPELPLHGSTQMGICDIAGARLLEDMGFSCGVLARELSLESIRAIHQAVHLPLEAFAHGAMCMSFSGGCLYSSMAGERSGNRGTCAQPCRKQAALCRHPGREDYCLSLSDLCMLEHLKDMEDAGVTWLKLEGRMKRPAYVAAVTGAYRAALDGAGPGELAEHRRRILALFDRGGSPTGYYYGDDAHTGCVAQADPPAALLHQIEEQTERKERKLPVETRLFLREGEPARLSLTLSQWPGPRTVWAEGPRPQEAEKPQSPERYLAQVQKLGGTPFQAAGGAAEMAPGLFLPAKELNALRRAGVEALEEVLRIRRPLPPEKMEEGPAPSPFQGRMELLAVVQNEGQARAAAGAGAELIALEGGLGAERVFQALQPLRKRAKLLISLPAAVPQGRETERLHALLQGSLLDGALCANLGQIALAKDLPLKIAGTQLGAFNREAVRTLKTLGFDRVILSLELTKAQMRDILTEEAAGISGYGRAQLMQLLHCPMKEALGCKNCLGPDAYLEDGAGRRFPLSPVRGRDGCLVRLLNCLPTDVLDLLGALSGIQTLQLAFYEEGPAAVEAAIGRARGARDGAPLPPPEKATRGHWNRAVE